MQQVRDLFKDAFTAKDDLVKNLDHLGSKEMEEKGVDKDSQIMLALDNALTNAKEEQKKGLGGRELAVCITKMEEAQMWLMKASW